MAYTRLDETAGDITWDGESSYTRLDETAGDVSFFVAPTENEEPRAAINTHPINSMGINSSGETLGVYAGKTAVKLHQSVAFFYTDKTVIQLKQEVQLRSTYENKSVAQIKQSVQSSASSLSAVKLIQRVQNSAALSGFYEKYGWDCEITIGSYFITTELTAKNRGLCDDMTLDVQEGRARGAVFTIIPPETTVDPQEFQGKQVTIKLRGSAGWYTVFTGWVDVPELNFLERKITFRCTDRRQDRIIKLGRDFVSAIGYYDEKVFGRAQDLSDELSKRLETVTKSFDFDNYGNPKLTAWAPKATADYTYGNTDVFYSNVDVKYTNRDKTINTIKLTLNYSYERLHQQGVNFSWVGYQNTVQGLRDWFTGGKGSFAGRDTIRTAANQGSWKFSQPITFEPLWGAQLINVGEGFLEWQPDIVTEETKGRTRFAGYAKDGEGNFVTVDDPPKLVPIYEPVNDANGNQIQDVIRRTITDNSSHLCLQASWSSALRFTQTVTEKYQMQVRTPQNIAKFGTIEAYDQVDIQDDYDTNEWENGDSISFTTENFYVDKPINREDMLSAMETMLNRARTQLLRDNRDIVVSFRTKILQPELDIYQTISLQVDDKLTSDSGDPHLYARGKVGSFKHIIDFNSTEAYTEVELFLSKADGTTTDTTSFAVLVPVQDPSYIGSPTTIVLPTHLGEDPDPANNPQAADWTGFIGNKELGNTVTGFQRTEYPESFVVKFPEIPDYLRQNIVYTSPFSENNFTILIPDDYLEVSF